MAVGCFSTRIQSNTVCQICNYTLQQPAKRRAYWSASHLQASSKRPQAARKVSIVPRTASRRITETFANFQKQTSAVNGSLDTWHRIATLKSKLKNVESHIRAIQASNRVEKEEVILEALDGLEDVAQQAIAIRARRPAPEKINIRQSSAGAILTGLESDESPPKKQETLSKEVGIDTLPSSSHISKLALNLVKNEKVFISPNILAVYIHLQRLIIQPRAIPEILYLYANKPVPIEGSSPPKFSKPSPKSAKQAIPPDLAEEALTAAIEAKDLTLALSVIDYTYCAPAWFRRRVITKLGLPIALASIAPLAIYMIAQEASVYSNYVDPKTFKFATFAGLSAYLVATVTLGFVTITTYNDNHDRVVWQPGTPLLMRYLREDERASLDRIACAWGFKELWRRGDEEGEDWEGLRQWILLKEMILDKTDLMPGMNTTSHPREED